MSPIDFYSCYNLIYSIVLGFKKTSLEKLRVNENQLVTIPESISKLENLRELEIDKNKIVSIPQSVGTLALTNLSLADNPLRYVVVLGV